MGDDIEAFVRHCCERYGYRAWERRDLYQGEPWSGRVSYSEFAAWLDRTYEPHQLGMLEFEPRVLFLHAGTA